MTKPTEHDKRLEDIVNHPSSIGITSARIVAKEVRLYLPNGDIIAEPDIMIYDAFGRLHIVEYKGAEDRERQAEKQLDTAIHYMQSLPRWNHGFKKIFVYGDMKYRRVK